MSWDPVQYERFAAERARPFDEFVVRIPTEDAVAVVDLGCGPGTMTATLAKRWPSAAILGIDSSPDMVAAAQAHATEQVSFRLGDIRAWRPGPGSVDVIVANASLQWVPDHAELLTGWAKALDDGGTLAFQVPLADGMPATGIMRELATKHAKLLERGLRGSQARSSLTPELAGVTLGTGPRAATPVLAPERYIEILARAGLDVDVWQTTYFHILPGDDPVLEWFSGTGLRPYLDALADDPTELADFRAAVAQRLRQAYPRHDYGTILPFPRLFVVATARSGPA